MISNMISDSSSAAALAAALATVLPRTNKRFITNSQKVENALPILSIPSNQSRGEQMAWVRK